MSYDTTVNDALDPPEARIAARQRGAARRWMTIAAVTLTGLLGSIVLARVLLR